jgi:hypothetical protein
MKRMAATVLVAMMLVMLVPAAGAETWKEKREIFVERRENFRETYEDWIEAKNDLRDAIRAGAPAAEIRAKARIVARIAYELRLSYLRCMRARVDATRGLSENDKAALLSELNGYISTIESYGENIRVAENWRAKREIVKELRDYWLGIRARVKQITAQLIVTWFRAFVERAEAFAGRIEAKIQELKDNGVDTSALENWLEDFNSHLEIANDWLDTAQALVDNDELWEDIGFRDIFRAAAGHIRKALTYLRDSFRNLKDIVSEIRRQRYTITLTGSGTLVAEGSGSAYISGTGLVKITTMENAVLVVSPNAHVKAVGEGTIETLENGDVRYEGFGSARITGHDITVSLSGKNIWMRASGTGTVTLTGTGTYWTYGENVYLEGSWTEEGVTATLATGKVQG